MREAVLAALAAATLGAPAPASEPPVALPPAEKMICKSQLQTGSLVARKKLCLTRAQWKYLNEQNESAARRMVEDGQSRLEGNPGGP